MNRRGFLKALGAAAVSIAAPSILPYEPKRIYSFGRPAPLIESDWSISETGDIRYVGNDDTSYTVLELHRYLQDTFESPERITYPNPSRRLSDEILVLENGFNIDDRAAKHLYAGSITQDYERTQYSMFSEPWGISPEATKFIKHGGWEDEGK